ncbi:RagB/SusD family nutrient uptake outer membrane protein [Sphingobacterium faecale]|uniref:RagB/SusD family nutrient uptake outer membrane protein n=1 Tax=Sphingobacterium faecale TaxID=2803775 RepID=A0ABS1RA24_9SPHI|nr:RagB/SusD family nutrient uptake outer membrane protein [Sphingobacterium faecale]MBL1411560.1 RagB/SusD family nutrient uptake outer membrane protein [Sphingobacterium faecale]
MMNVKKIYSYILIVLWGMAATSCSKTTFLDAKPDESMTVPATLAHYMAMMDSDVSMNGAGGFGSSPLYPAVTEWASDNVWVPHNRYVNNLMEMHRAVYSWSSNPYPATDMQEWSKPYAIILSCNVVLSGLEKIEINAANQIDWKMVKGMALFNRSHLYAMLLHMFAPVYDPAKDNDSPAIPLRMGTDFSEKLKFSTVEECYTRIINDLEEAMDLLPIDPLYKTRPSKRSCWALLSRLYLWMSDFEKSNHYANLALEANADLLDYNVYSTTANYPFPRFNAEVIFNCTMRVFSSYARIDSILFDSYNSNDLRKELFYKKANDMGYSFFGNYDGAQYVFAGLANDELYFNRAESYARMGKVDLAMSDLNKLLETRYRKVNGLTTYIPHGTTDREQAIELILRERRKQLVWRGLRWMDLKRLNLDPVYAKTLKRRIGDLELELKPNDPRYVFPVPDVVTDLTPDLIK